MNAAQIFPGALCLVKVDSHCFKCKFGLFGVSFTYSRSQSARPQFGEVGGGTSTDTKQCVAADKINNERYFSHPNKGQINIRLSVCYNIFNLFAIRQPFPMSNFIYIIYILYSYQLTNINSLILVYHSYISLYQHHSDNI